jgi:sulfoxide reductase heme-binding subunit YedZ
MARPRRSVLKPLVFALCLVPLALLAWAALAGELGANPIEKVTRTLGDWALRFLVIALAVTPLRRLSGWSALARLRRMLGLYAFFYAVLHLSSYVVLDQFFAWPDIVKDIIKRPYITVGMTAFLLLVPLAVTSTDRMVKRLGGRNWRRLHRIVYVAGPLGALHYVMLVKADLREPLLYATILAVLLGYRLAATVRERLALAARRAQASHVGS